MVIMFSPCIVPYLTISDSVEATSFLRYSKETLYRMRGIVIQGREIPKSVIKFSKTFRYSVMETN